MAVDGSALIDGGAVATGCVGPALGCGVGRGAPDIVAGAHPKASSATLSSAADHLGPVGVPWVDRWGFTSATRGDLASTRGQVRPGHRAMTVARSEAIPGLVDATSDHAAVSVGWRSSDDAEWTPDTDDRQRGHRRDRDVLRLHRPSLPLLDH